MKSMRSAPPILVLTTVFLGALASVAPGEAAAQSEGLACVADPNCIPAGVDCWSTDCGATKFNFCDLYGNALPPGFFGIGSEKFEGEILLGGATRNPDTQVQIMLFGTMSVWLSTVRIVVFTRLM